MSETEWLKTCSSQLLDNGEALKGKNCEDFEAIKRKLFKERKSGKCALFNDKSEYFLKSVFSIFFKL